MKDEKIAAFSFSASETMLFGPSSEMVGNSKLPPPSEFFFFKESGTAMDTEIIATARMTETIIIIFLFFTLIILSF